MMSVIKNLLLQIVDNIDSGNSNLTEEEELEIIKALRRYSRTDIRYSKQAACKYLNISRSTFDSYVRDGLLNKGHKESGFKELHWTKRELDKFIKTRRDIKNR